MSRSSNFSPCSQLEWLYGVERLVKTEEDVVKAMRKRSAAVHHAMRLLTLELFSHLPAFLGNNGLYILDNDRLVKWSEVKKLQFPAPASSLVLALLFYEVVQSLHIDRPAVEPLRVKELSNKEHAVRPPSASADVGPFLEDQQPLKHRTKVTQLGSVHNSFVKKRKPSSSMMIVRRWSKKMTRNSFDEEVKAAVESVAKVENVIEVTPAATSALKPKVESTFQVIKEAMK